MDLIAELKDVAWLIGVVVIPLVAHNVKLQLNVTRMSRLLDQDKIMEFTREFAIVQERQRETRADMEKFRVDIKELFGRTDR